MIFTNDCHELTAVTDQGSGAGIGFLSHFWQIFIFFQDYGWDFSTVIIKKNYTLNDFLWIDVVVIK